ncbi:hypothetical protein [Thiolapillus sp.]
MKSGFWTIAATVVLMSLGVLLYFSASAFLNVLAIPLLQDLDPEQTDQMIAMVLVVISFLAALIGGFFSVFLFEMAGGGYRPLLMGILFSLPAVLVQTYVVVSSGVAIEMMTIYALESSMVLLAFVLMAFAGRSVSRRFFSEEAHPA